MNEQWPAEAIFFVTLGNVTLPKHWRGFQSSEDRLRIVIRPPVANAQKANAFERSSLHKSALQISWTPAAQEQ